jgi:hypothetical protein
MSDHSNSVESLQDMFEMKQPKKSNLNRQQTLNRQSQLSRNADQTSLTENVDENESEKNKEPANDDSMPNESVSMNQEVSNTEAKPKKRALKSQPTFSSTKTNESSSPLPSSSLPRPMNNTSISNETINRNEESDSGVRNPRAKSSNQKTPRPVIQVQTGDLNEDDFEDVPDGKTFKYYYKKIVKTIMTSINIIIAITMRVIFSLHAVVAIVYVYLIKQDEWCFLNLVQKRFFICFDLNSFFLIEKYLVQV